VPAAELDIKRAYRQSCSPGAGQQIIRTWLIPVQNLTAHKLLPLPGRLERDTCGAPQFTLDATRRESTPTAIKVRIASFHLVLFQ
jgi:hypothetical protein